MTLMLDLSITLSLPPTGVPQDTLASFELRCDALGTMRANGLLPSLISDQERADMRWYLEEYWQWPYEQFAVRARRIEQQLEIIGRRLYDALFGSADAQRIVQPWNLQPDAQRQISILGTIPSALSLPWELLHDGRGFLALRARNPVSIIRRLPEHDLAALLTPFTPPLRVLLVTARPEGTGFVDPRSIARELLDELEPQIDAGAVVVEFLRPPTLPNLRERLSDLKQPPIHILHFDGHGAFEAETLPNDELRLRGGTGQLAFEDADGRLDLVEAGTLAQVLQDSGVKLMVLTACQSALGSGDDLFSSVASRLIQGGVDAVVAMSASVLVVGAAKYVEGFYRALAAGQPAPLAHERARQALHDNPKRHSHQRTLDTEGAPVELRDWWLPHFYQQRPLVLQSSKPKGRRKPTARAQLSNLPPAPRYGFGGRARDLLELERHLLHGRLVVIHGFGGIGKTELAAEAARWLTRTGMYAGALFVSFEHGGDSALLLGELGRHLGVYDGSYNPNDPSAALAKLRPALKKVPTLLIADNLESILAGGDALLSVEERTRLWDTLLALRDTGCSVILTTRGTNFDNGRLAPGEQVRHLPLEGLAPDDAYALALRLLDNLSIPHTRAPYLEMRQLLEHLDQQPLAIQLVLPALRDTTLVKIDIDFERLLPTFTDDTATGRNRSLLTSLNYSLRRLTDKQRALLTRLAPFEGGGMEPEILAITEIPEVEWASLCLTLEQAALVRTVQVHERISPPYLFFHPILTPHLRSQPETEDSALLQRYATRYAWFADYLYGAERDNPQVVRALAQRELPNLHHALDLLLTRGEHDEAMEMADDVGYFLNLFGRRREHENLLRKMGQLLSSPSTTAELTRAEFLFESNLSELDYKRGDLRAAYARLNALLARIEALPEGTPLGKGSYSHCVTLSRLARCLRASGQPTAEKPLRFALAIIESLIVAQPDHQPYLRERGGLLVDLGIELIESGNYEEARTALEEALKVKELFEEAAGKGVVLAELGSLALKQHAYSEAAMRYTEALTIFHTLNDTLSEASAWHQLGMVAKKQQQWSQSEHCYREALMLFEQNGTLARAAMSCSELARIAVDTNRWTEAEGWLKHALELDQEVQPDSSLHANHLNNLAGLILSEVQEGRADVSRLTEARSYAERALAIKEKLDLSAAPWNTLDILADIAALEGRAAALHTYRRRERETFAAFAGNRWHIDQQHGWLIAAITAAAQGNTQARAAVEQALPQWETMGWHITESTRRIWAGERDWEALAERLDRHHALLVLRVLETLADRSAPPQS